MKVLIQEAQILQAVQRIASEIRNYHGQPIVLVGILKGAFVFLADLARYLEERKVDFTIDFLAISSYGDRTETSGEVKILKDLDEDITGKQVIIVEDIIDTGLSLAYIISVLDARKPASIAVAVLLDKPERRLVEVPVAYRGFKIPDEFVVGYGLDLAGKYRGLRDVRIYERE